MNLEAILILRWKTPKTRVQFLPNCSKGDQSCQKKG